MPAHRWGNRKPRPKPEINLPRKRCKNCPKFFRMTKPNREFCSDKCRREWGHNKAGFGRLREFMPKMIAREVREQLAELRAVIVADVLKEIAYEAALSPEQKAGRMRPAV